MNKDWILVMIAAVFEVTWVTGLKYAYDFWTWSGTVIAIIISFYLMIRAGKNLPVGTVYAVFVGLGTVGTVLTGMLYFQEDFSIEKVILILVLVTGIIGLKFVTPNNHEEGETH